MAFADLAKKHATFVAGHGPGEDIDYRAWPLTTWARFKAQVIRDPADPVGEVLRNVIRLFVSKANVPDPSKGKDQVRLPADQEPGVEPATFTVVECIESAGGWALECNRK